MSHLALAEDSQNSDTKKQINHFKKAVKLLRKYSIFPKYIHLGNSPGLLNNKNLRLSSLSNASRIGRALYGISSIKNNNLKQVLQLKTHIIQIKKIKQKQFIQINEHYISYDKFIKALNSRNALALEILKDHILFGNVSKIADIFWEREYERR